MRFERALEEAARFGVADRLDQLRQHIPTSWIEAALQWTGTASIRRRRLPADQVVWLVICMALFRNEPIERIVDMLGLALPDKGDTKVAKSAVTQARQRLGDEPMGQLFAMTAKTWARRSAEGSRRLLLPERRVERVFPRAVKIKMSSYARKRPTRRRPTKKGAAK